MIRFDAVELAQGGFSLTADFEIPARGITALIGPSGAGKSTLLSAIAGFLDPVRGRILIGGRDMAGVAPAARPVSILFQEHNLFGHLRVWQNVGLGRDPALRLDRAGRQAVSQALERVGLGGLEQRRPSELSGGQRQRVALARVLLRHRPVLLLDEPFAALGPALKTGMLDLVQRLAADEGMTVLMVTHDPGDARRAADAVALVEGGRVRAPGPTAEVFARPDPALAAYLGQG